MTMLEKLVERSWEYHGADRVSHTHERCFGCMQAELGWRHELRRNVYGLAFDMAVIAFSAGLLTVSWWRSRRQ